MSVTTTHTQGVTMARSKVRDEAIANTVESGKAVQLAFRTGEEMKRIQMALRHAVGKMGMKMRYSKGAGERIVAWAEETAEWHRQVRHGALQSFTHHRRLLVQGGELSQDARQGLIDLLDYMEDHLVTLWPVVDAIEAHGRMTRRASVKVRGK